RLKMNAEPWKKRLNKTNSSANSKNSAPRKKRKRVDRKLRRYQQPMFRPKSNQSSGAVSALAAESGRLELRRKSVVES
ncbi:MAG: hypothetical protein VX122_07135, partial [Pseudomonadota bacterium]|nr:hypothetical protein [Pseudomonadota bacterium]